MRAVELERSVSSTHSVLPLGGQEFSWVECTTLILTVFLKRFMRRQHTIHASSLERDFCSTKIVAFSEGLETTLNLDYALVEAWIMKRKRAGHPGGDVPLGMSPRFAETQQSRWVRMPNSLPPAGTLNFWTFLHVFSQTFSLQCPFWKLSLKEGSFQD